MGLECDAHGISRLEADASAMRVLLAHDEMLTAVEAHVVVRVSAEIDDVLELAPEFGLAAGLHEIGMFRPHHEGDAA